MPNESSVARPGAQPGPAPANSARAGHSDPAGPGWPVLSVVRGQPTDAELAAVIAVLAARSRAGAARAGSVLGEPGRAGHRACVLPVPGACLGWRAAAAAQPVAGGEAGVGLRPGMVTRRPPDRVHRRVPDVHAQALRRGHVRAAPAGDPDGT